MFFLFSLFVLCRHTLLRRVLAVLPSQSFYSFFSLPSPLLFLLLPLLPPFALCRPGYSIKEESGSWWTEVSLGSKHTLAVTIFSLTLFSVFSFLFSLSSAGAFLFLPGSSDTQRRGEDKEGWRERLRESKKRREKSKCR